MGEEDDDDHHLSLLPPAAMLNGNGVNGVNGVHGGVNGVHAAAAVESAAPPRSDLRGNDASKGWIVQKFGGTSVGKVPVEIAEGIVGGHLADHRLAIVCSARSSDTKRAGTTNRLLRAAREAEVTGSQRYVACVREIEEDHLHAAATHIRSPALRVALAAAIQRECADLVAFLGAAQMIGEISTHTLDRVVSQGENLACRFMAALLEDRGIAAEFVDLAAVVDFPVVHKESLDATFYRRLTEALADRLARCAHRVPVVTGYFGPIAGGLLKQIGRGYTDLCAALIAVGLDAQELQVWKEVDGIFTANPHQVPTARLLQTITPAEAAELTYYGSEVIHPFTMEQVIRARIPIRIRNVLNRHNLGTIILPDAAASGSVPGTPAKTGSPTMSGASSPIMSMDPHHSPLSRVTITRKDRGNSVLGGSGGGPRRHSWSRFPKRPTAVTIKNNIIVLNVHSNKRTLSHGFFAGIFSVLDRCKLSVDLISTSEVHVSMALHSENAWMSSSSSSSSGGGNSGGGGGGEGGEGEAEAASAAAADEADFEKAIVDDALRVAVHELAQFGTVHMIDGMAILSLVGRQMHNMMGVAGRMFSVLGENNVNIEMISQGASEINISCVIEERDAVKAVNVLHANLFTFLE